MTRTFVGLGNNTAIHLIWEGEAEKTKVLIRKLKRIIKKRKKKTGGK